MLSALAALVILTPAATTLEGVFSIEHACNPVPALGELPECHESLVLQPKGLRKVQLDFDEEIGRSLEPDRRMVGQTLAVEGYFTDEDHRRFRVQHANFRPGLAKANTVSAQSTAKPYVTILVRFSDYTGVTPQPRDWFDDLFSAAYPRLGHYFADQSSGAITIAGSSVVGWFNLPHPLAYYQTSTFPNLDGEKLFADAVALADPTVDFTKFEGINIIMNGTFNTSVGGFASYQDGTMDGRHIQWPTTMNTPSNGWLSLLAHEMGHTFGFDHSSGPYPDKPYDSRWDVMSGGTGAQQQDAKYGGVPVGYNAYHRQDLGWLPSDRVFYAKPGTNQTIRLERLNSPTASGYLTAIVFRGSGAQYFTVESRQRVSYDESVPGDAVIIHECDRNRMSFDSRYGTSLPDRRSQVVDPDNDSDPDDWNETEPKLNSHWTPGETYTDPATGIQIQVVSAGATYYNVKIVVPTTLNGPNEVVNTADNGMGSLRGALDLANYFPQLPESQSVSFKIPAGDPNFSAGVFKISPITGFTGLKKPNFVVDGSTQTAFGGNTNTSGPEIEIDGTNAGAYANAFRIDTTGVQIRNLALNSFNGPNVWVYGAFGGGSATIAGCYVGLNAKGNLAKPSAQNGIVIEGNGCTIGGLTAADRNVISGNSFSGLAIVNGTNNTVVGNWIGLNAAGTAAIPNQQNGIACSSVKNSVIGGTSASARNVVSGNKGGGIAIFDAGSDGNQVLGNYVGLNPGGTTAIKNESNGIYIGGGANNIVGGTVSGARNVCSGNIGSGISVYGVDTSGTQVLGNYVGLNAAGSAAVQNEGNGISVGGGAKNSVVGGTAAGARNVSSGNKYGGIAIYGAGSDGSIVQGNYLGVNPAGTAAMPNLGNGISVTDGAKNTTVGGTSVEARNLCSGNGYSGILIHGNGTSSNLVQGNYIGMNAAGTAALGNGSGIDIGGQASGNTVGGATATAKNVIAASVYNGVQIFDGAHDNKIQGNSIGTNAAGTAALGNTYAGIVLVSAANHNLIGGPNPGEGNVVCGNGGSGIQLNDDLTDSNTIQNNSIGVTAGGAALRNTYQGVAIWNGPASNLIKGNTIAFNSDNIGCGVETGRNAPAGNTFSQNKIYGSQYLGINLYNNDGVTPNDSLDVDTGPNGLQNFPVLNSATRTSGGTAIAGTLNSRASRSYLIEFFSSDAGNSSGNGEGQRYIGATTVTTNSSGNATFNFTAAAANGTTVSATATDTVTGDTSEFSANRSLTNGVIGLTLNPASVDNGVASTGTVTLGSAAGTGGAVVALTSNKSFATVPASVTVTAGQQTGTFTVTTAAVASDSSATITGTYNSIARSATLTVRATTALKTLAVNPTYIRGSATASGTVTLTAPAAVGGMPVTLTESNAYVTVPASVTVAAGNLAKSFLITTTNPPANQTVPLTATLGAISKTVTLTIARQPKLIVFSFSPASLVGGQGSTGTLKTDFAASVGNGVVAIGETASYLTTPTSVTIPTGAATTTFAATTSSVAVAQTATVTATLNGGSFATTITVLPAIYLSSVTVTPTSVKGGSSVTGKVTLNAAAAAGGAVVTLTDNSAKAVTPASATVPAGSTNKTFTITTSTVSANTAVTVTGVYAGVTRTATLTLTP